MNALSDSIFVAGAVNGYGWINGPDLWPAALDGERCQLEHSVNRRVGRPGGSK